MNPQMRAEWLDMVKKATKLRMSSGQMDGRDAIIMELLYQIQGQSKALVTLAQLLQKAPHDTVRRISRLSRN